MELLPAELTEVRAAPVRNLRLLLNLQRALNKLATGCQQSWHLVVTVYKSKISGELRLTIGAP